MRRTAAALLVPLLASAALVGCGSTSSSSGASTNQSVTVSGSFGKSPTVTIPKQQASSKLAVKTEIHGSGPVLVSTDSALANLAIYVWSGKTHKLLDSTFASAPQIVPAQLGLPGLVTALKGAKMGSRILAVLPPKYGYGTSGNSNIGVTGKDTTVWVIDLIKQFPPTAAASGTHVTNGGGALPTVSTAAGGAPAITIPKKSPPSKLVVTTLIKGSGPKIAAGQTIVAQYVAVNWRTGQVFNSTWPSSSSAGSPFAFQLGGQVIPGWNTGLAGVPVGSRVMLVVPPADGYGKSGNSQAGIKGTDTLVFVIDILDAQSPTA